MPAMKPTSKHVFVVALIFFGLLAAFMYGVWFTCRRQGISRIESEIITLRGDDALCLSSNEHPPTAHSHVTQVDIDHKNKTIRITGYLWPLQFNSPHIYNRWPLVVQRGLNSDTTYSIEYWTGSAYKKHTELQIDKSGKYKLLNISR